MPNPTHAPEYPEWLDAAEYSDVNATDIFEVRHGYTTREQLDKRLSKRRSEAE